MDNKAPGAQSIKYVNDFKSSVHDVDYERHIALS